MAISPRQQHPALRAAAALTPPGKKGRHPL
jgi:hypothetical protein